MSIYIDIVIYYFKSLFYAYSKEHLSTNNLNIAHDPIHNYALADREYCTIKCSILKHTYNYAMMVRKIAVNHK